MSDVEKGRAFERLCQWYLETAPEYRGAIKRVWLWSDWPERWGRDAGIDLIAETPTGEIWAIQAKAYSPGYAIKKADVDSFLSESNRPGVHYRLLIATTDGLGATAARTLHEQEKLAGVKLLSQLRIEDVPWPMRFSDLKPAKAPREVPWEHQDEAVRDVLARLDGLDRGQLLMACGTGKTLTSLWIDERLGSRRTLVLVPSLSLLGQTLRAWATSAATPFAYLAVCSDASVTGTDALTEHASDLGFPVTTDTDQIRRFLSEGVDRRVVFSTYQSSPMVARAQLGSETPSFDVVFADEAHRCAGRASADFATVLDADKIRARKRIFMTATPRFLSPRARDTSEIDTRELVSMDDDEVFGPVLHRLSFGAAIEADLLADYRIVVVGVDHSEYSRLAEHGELVTRGDAPITDARTLGRQIGLARAMHRFDLHRVISFHGRVAAARRFANELPEVIEWMPEKDCPSGTIWSRHVSGAMNAGQRDALLDRFRHLTEGERGLLSNARCLAEGVDVPSVDAVAFVDPRSSTVDIIQAVGRAIRKAPGKDLGTIVIPVFVDAQISDAEALASSAFAPVWDVVRGLRAHDNLFADQLDQARRRLGREGGAVDTFPKIVLDIPHAVGSDFATAFDARLVDETTAAWELWFGVLERFVDREGHARVPARHNEAGHRLGRWINHARERRSIIPAERIRRLEGLPGWTWDARIDSWAQAVVALESFVTRERHARVPASHLESDFRLGAWVSRIRAQRSELVKQRVEFLERLPGWTWDPSTSRWASAYAALEAFVVREDHLDIPRDHVELGVNLRDWVHRQRRERAEGFLSAERAARLEQIKGWSWNAEAIRLASVAGLGATSVLGRAEVAEVLGTRSVNLAKIPDLPAPFDQLKSGSLWHRHEIEALAVKRAGAEPPVSLGVPALPEPGVFVGRAEAAEILGVLSANLGKVRQLPEPTYRLKATPLWRRAEIERIARERAEAGRRRRPV